MRRKEIIEELDFEDLEEGDLFNFMLSEKKDMVSRDGMRRFRPIFDELEEVLDRVEHADDYFNR